MTITVFFDEDGLITNFAETDSLDAADIVDATPVGGGSILSDDYPDTETQWVDSGALADRPTIDVASELDVDVDGIDAVWFEAPEGTEITVSLGDSDAVVAEGTCGSDGLVVLRSVLIGEFTVDIDAPWPYQDASVNLRCVSIGDPADATDFPPGSPSTVLTIVIGQEAPTGLVGDAKAKANVWTWNVSANPHHAYWELTFYDSEEDAENDLNGTTISPIIENRYRDKFDKTIGDGLWARVTDVDEDGNRSEKSDWATVVVRGVEDDEIVSISGEKIVGDIPVVSDLADDLASEAATRAAETAALAYDLAAEAATRAADMAAEVSIRASADTTLATEAATNALAMAETSRSLLDRIQGVEDYVAEGLFEGYEQKEQLRTELIAQQNTDRASFTSQITVAVAENAAAVARIDTLEADTATLEASVSSIALAYVAGDAALSAEITALSAGTQNQFDHTDIWRFDTTVEDWTGNGTPTQTAGSIRPANHASDPYIVSPDGLDVDGAAYTQVRARIKKVGTPTWEGYHYWKAAADTTWDAGRRDSFSEPTYDGSGYALITINSEWAGTIRQIRLDLSSVQDGSNYFLLDWIAVGRPSPGASSAELATEVQARIDADSAAASDITALEARMNDAETGIDATASAVSTLEGEVSVLDGTVSAHTTAITGLESDIEGKAEASAVDSLQTQIDDFGGAAGISSLSESVRALRNEVDPVADTTIENAFAALLRDQDIRAVVTNASQTLTTRIDATDTSVAAVAAAVTALEAGIPDLASAEAFEALETRVTVTETSIDTQASQIASLETEVDGKASSSALSALDSRVTTAEGTITTQAGQITTINTALPGKASTSAVSALDTRVTATEGSITTISGQITTINSTLSGKASTSAVSAIDARLTEAEGDITGINSALTALDTEVDGKASSSALSSLDTRVTTAEGTISTHTGQITSLSSSVAGKADASALSSLSTEVSDIDGEVTSIANALTDLFAGDVAGDYASARVQFTAVGGPTGWARYAVSVRSGSSETFVDAGFYMDVNISSGLSRIVMKADQVIITDDADAISDPVFQVADGVIYLNGDVVRGGVRPENLNSGTVSVNNNHVIGPIPVDGGERNILAELTMTFEPSTADVVARRFSLFGIVGSTSTPLTAAGQLFFNIDTGSGWTFPLGVYFDESDVRLLSPNMTASCQSVYSIGMAGSTTEITFGLECHLPSGESGVLKNCSILVVHHATAEAA